MSFEQQASCPKFEEVSSQSHLLAARILSIQAVVVLGRVKVEAVVMPVAVSMVEPAVAEQLAHTVDFRSLEVDTVTHRMSSLHQIRSLAVVLACRI